VLFPSRSEIAIHRHWCLRRWITPTARNRLSHYLWSDLLAIECAFHEDLPMSVKEQVLQAIHRPPDDIDFRDVADEIAFLSALRKAERDIKEGRISTNEQMKARLAEWTAQCHELPLTTSSQSKK
jgi:hypothetical protein